MVLVESLKSFLLGSGAAWGLWFLPASLHSTTSAASWTRVAAAAAFSMARSCSEDSSTSWSRSGSRRSSAPGDLAGAAHQYRWNPAAGRAAARLLHSWLGRVRRQALRPSERHRARGAGWCNGKHQASESPPNSRPGSASDRAAGASPRSARSSPAAAPYRRRSRPC